jgi:iron-sulfur cluster insertion protein
LRCHTVGFTENATKQVKKPIDDKRMVRQTLSCAYLVVADAPGFQYGFTFEEQVNDDDTLVQKDTVTLLD